jgi:hypothetical protein
MSLPDDIGELCTSGAQCNAFCLRSGRAALCSALCSLEQAKCPFSAVCVDDGNGDDLGFCAEACNEAADCRAPGARCTGESAKHCSMEAS